MTGFALHLDAQQRGTITLAGVDITGLPGLAVDRVEITAESEHVSRVVFTLEVYAMHVDLPDGTVVTVDDDTAAALSALGWTPPGGEDSP